MKKYLFEMVIVLFIIIEVVLIAFNYMNKYEISKMLEIDNINDFYIQEFKGVFSYGSAKPIFIKFKISVDKYEKYNLKYEDVNSDDYIYEGEITNKKLKISDNYYMCYYETVIYNKDEKDKFRKMRNNRIFLNVNNIILIFLIFVYVIKKIKTRINKKMDYKSNNSRN